MDLHFQEPYQFAKSEKYEPFCVSRLLFWRHKLVAGARHGNSLVVRRVSPGRIIVVLFWTKYAVPRQIKPVIFKLTTSRGQNNLCIVFIFVCCEEKGCYRIVSPGHLNFDCRSYCGLSRRMQGRTGLIPKIIPPKLFFGHVARTISHEWPALTREI